MCFRLGLDCRSVCSAGSHLRSGTCLVFAGRAELQGHIQNTRHQYNLPAFEKRIDRAVNRERIADHFDDPIVAASIQIGDITRFGQVGNFISYARLVKCAHESAGKRVNGRNNKIGNAHLKWAFSEAACLFLRESDQAKAWHQKLVSRYGKAKALSIIAQRIGRTAYFVLKRRTPFDREKFFASLS
ncbi:MAG: IS110 family transposase [Lysobacterales bacterium]|nr:MAG: IS110 family transposase [Xanthomonadales bacterium]